jgi:hypothetical protein
MSRIPHFLDSRLTASVEVVGIRCRPLFTLQKYILVLIFVRDRITTEAIMWLERLGQLKFSDHSENACIFPTGRTYL